MAADRSTKLLSCLHHERIAPDKLEPIHSRNIGGAYKVHKQHASRSSCPVLISLHSVKITVTVTVLLLFFYYIMCE